MTYANSPLNVPAGGGVELVGACQTRAQAGVVHGDFNTRCRLQVFCPFVPHPGGIGGTVGQHGTTAFAVGHFLQQGYDGLPVAPGQLNSIQVFLGEDTPLVTFHGPGDGHAGGDGIQAVAVADFIGLEEGVLFIAEEGGSEGAAGFIFGPLRRPQGPAAGVNLIFGPTAQGAVVATILLHLVLV